MPPLPLCLFVLTRPYLFVTSLTIVIPLDLDRSNLGNARLQGLDVDVLGGDPTGILYDWVNSVFFFSYVSILPKRLQLALTVGHG
jgi:hypothetical protein